MLHDFRRSTLGRDGMNHGISFMLGFVCALIGVGMGSGAAYWVEGPTNTMHRDYTDARDYDAPVCPPGLEPSFFGVTVIDGKSSPIYLCLAPELGGSDEKIVWDDAANLQTVPS